MPPLRGLRLALACALLPLASSCRAENTEPAERPALGLMGTIPIYWGEGGRFGDVLDGQGAGHWARAQLERRYALEPLDVLTPVALAGVDYLLLAQPRVLSAAENVALDDWVRQGGQLLLFADPMLTGHTRFAIGDRRRPQDVALLSPILAHWGLTMAFDAEEAEGFVLVEEAIPVNRAGHFALADGDASCALAMQGVLARCRIGRGRATILADAALLDLYEPHPSAAAALDSLLAESFARAGEIAGN